ncbi:hypothetical protein [Kineosporia babensis]|uniref:Uncharacterized protein n=1 Tax=Kineosporia babensis TaxID=499548 RepID=A0A9X1NAT7_9ACTN|nr:hypothetical protein [Kineosporia babensis]MCD5311777.1 hypothetical protein [Kineosporia babensis]
MSRRGKFRPPSDKLSDAELGQLIAGVHDLSGEEVWSRILSVPADHWDGGANWEFKSEHEAEFDAFLQKAFSAIPVPPPMAYIDSLAWNYMFAMLGSPDSEHKGLRAYEAAYRKMIEAITVSIEQNLVFMAEDPCCEVRPEQIRAELERFRSETKPPQFFR